MFHSVGLWWFGDTCFTVWVCGGSVMHFHSVGLWLIGDICFTVVVR